MSSKKLETILSLIEIADRNLKNAQQLILQLSEEKGYKTSPFVNTGIATTPGTKSKDEDTALEVVEGNFDGENMMGDNGQIYPIPQNYASKTQLVVGDRMKWILTNDREIFKLIQPVPRIRATGTFSIEGENYIVLIDEFTNPVKMLKASATYAMKNLGLKFGDQVAIYIPQDGTPTWGAFISVVKPGDVDFVDGPVRRDKVTSSVSTIEASSEDLDLAEFKLNEPEKEKPASEVDYF
jgi:hypothetical protein